MSCVVRSDKREYYVYVHRKSDTGDIFYVGKGKGRRAYAKDSRNVWWKRTVNRHGVRVEIILSGLSEECAFSLEAAYINRLRAMGVNLVNVTDGGRGTPGARPRPETRAKLRKCQSGENNGFYGKRHTEETKLRMSRMRLGVPTGIRPMLGRSGAKNPRYDHTVRTFYHPDHGEFTGTRYEFSRKYGITSLGNLSSMISGRLKHVKGWRLRG